MTTIIKEPRTERHPLRARLWEAGRVRRNVGGMERGARMLIGVSAAIGAYAVGALWLRVALGIVGAAGLLTSTAGYCPANEALRRDSYHRSQR